MEIAARMDLIPFSGIRKVFEDVSRREQRGEKIIHLEIGRPDFDTPHHIKAAAKKALDEGQVHYVSNYGVLPLREAIARKLKKDNGMVYDPEREIIVTVGVTEAIFIAMMALLNPGDEVLVPAPCFPNYLMCARMAGAVPVEVPIRAENAYNPDIRDFEAKLSNRTRMLIITTPANPTGAVIDQASLEELAAFAVQHDLFVLSDEIYEKMIYDGRQHHSIGSLPQMRSRSMILNGFSKNYAMTGWRLGYVAADAELIAALVRIHQYAVVCTNAFAQWGAMAALNGPQDCVAEMVHEFDRRRNMVIQRLEKMPGLFFVRPQGAFYIYVDITALGQNARWITESLLNQAQVAVVPWDDAHIRISYANSYENLVVAMDKIETALQKL